MALTGSTVWLEKSLGGFVTQRVVSRRTKPCLVVTSVKVNGSSLRKCALTATSTLPVAFLGLVITRILMHDLCPQFSLQCLFALPMLPWLFLFLRAALTEHHGSVSRNVIYCLTFLRPEIWTQDCILVKTSKKGVPLPPTPWGLPTSVAVLVCITFTPVPSPVISVWPHSCSLCLLSLQMQRTDSPRISHLRIFTVFCRDPCKHPFQRSHWDFH